MSDITFSGMDENTKTEAKFEAEAKELARKLEKYEAEIKAEIKAEYEAEHGVETSDAQAVETLPSVRKKIIILGVTGSIGRQALSVIRESDHLELVGASVHSNKDQLYDLIEEFKLKNACVSHDSVNVAPSYLGCHVFSGPEGLEDLVRCECDMVLTSVVGLSGLKATVAAIEAGRDIALANKETLVGAGELVMALAKQHGVAIYPVDSEHSAIFQSLQGYGNEDIKRIILTASGGPFRAMGREELEKVTVDDALKHPNWIMGRKITIDSATLMNKGLEVIEARWLFDTPAENIVVHVHPESILHSGVEFNDNSVIAQLGNPDMRLPIQYALNYPLRLSAVTEPLDLFKVGKLTFEKPDFETFRCLGLAYEALEKGGYYPLILNTADEIAVELFLEEEITFLEIAEIIEFAMEHFASGEEFTLDGVMQLDALIREELAEKFLNR